MQSLGAAVSELNVNSRYIDFVKKEMKFKTSNRKRIYLFIYLFIYKRILVGGN